MKKPFVFLLFIIFSTACHSNKKITFTAKENIDNSATENMTFSPVDIVVLKNYAVNSSILLPDAVNYKFIVSAEEFHKIFHMTKASPGTAIVPDFNRQAVVAIILQPTERVVSVDINKAERNDEDLNIYYTITDTTSWTTYPHTIKAIAAVQKSDGVKRVNFYNDNVKEKMILMND